MESRRSVSTGRFNIEAASCEFATSVDDFIFFDGDCSTIALPKSNEHFFQTDWSFDCRTFSYGGLEFRLNEIVCSSLKACMQRCAIGRL